MHLSGSKRRMAENKSVPLLVGKPKRKRVRNVCVAFRAASEQSNRAGCLRGLEVLEHEYCYLKNKPHELFQLEQQRLLAAGVRYPMQNH